MAKHPGKCPKCGGRLEFDTAVDERILCPACQAMLSLPGKAKLSDRVDPLVGERLGEFEIVELLGRGGMGAVYKARQPSLDRFVAIKVLPRAFSRDATFIERFAREARDAAAVIHPHIIQVYAVGQDRGFQFIAMELVDGESLADVLRREGPLSPERALAVMKQVAAALGVAHEAGIVHRDIKPSNILLTSRGLAKVADFGLAKRPGVDASVTMTGATLGTPLYFPPEIARGQQADPRSDLYSLGAAFYHLLAGRPPFEGGSAAELALKHAETRVPSLGDIAPGVPPDLCRVIHRLLRKNARERYQSADELLEALDRVEAHLSVSQHEPTQTMPGTARPSIAERVEAKQQRRRRTTLIAAIGGAAALVLVLLLVLSRRRDRAASVPPPTPPKPGTRHPEPAPAAPPLERNAEIVFNNAQTCAAREDWPKALSHLDRLDARYAKTQFCAAHRKEIDALRAEADAALEPTPPGTARWEAAWKEADAKAKALLGEKRFGEAIAQYDALVDRFQELPLRQRVEAATADVRKQADAAWRQLEQRVRGLAGDGKFADARAALGPAVERYGLPDKADLAKTLLKEIDAAEKQHQAAATEAQEDAARRAEQERLEAEREKRRQAEARYARALEPIEKLVGAWRFREAADALGKLDFDQADLAARLATRRDEVARLTRLKAKMIQRINTAKPRWRKSTLLIPGLNADLVKADDEGITAKVPPGKPGVHTWRSLTPRSVQRLVQLTIDTKDADDCLAAGLLTLALKDVTTAEKHFEKARTLGAAIDRYLDPLAAAAFAQSKALLEKKQFSEADAVLSNLDKRYPRTPWLASHKDEFASAREAARVGIAEAEAEKLYARAVKLFKADRRFDLKPVIDKLKADYPQTRPVTDEQRAPSLAQMAVAVEKLGEFLTVRKDGKGDFTSIQEAINAAPPNSLIEIQDQGPYRGPIVVHKEGIALRGRSGVWPVVVSVAPSDDVKPALEVGSPGARIARIAVALHAADPSAHCIVVRRGACQMRFVLACMVPTPRGDYHPADKFRSLFSQTEASTIEVRDSIFIGPGSFRGGEATIENCLWVRGRCHLYEHRLLYMQSRSEFRACTLFGDIGGQQIAFRDCILHGFHSKSRPTRLRNCDVLDAGEKLGDQSFTADPQFRDPKNLDYRLKPTSPCRKRASDGGDIGCRYTPEMLEMLKKALELRKKGIIKF